MEDSATAPVSSRTTKPAALARRTELFRLHRMRFSPVPMNDPADTSSPPSLMTASR
ncbi:hypothetical protein [Lentzea albida]|uniref:hypothetical protein n=1 Tax=Lentzea albida TaxID=65499 RepID=UPI0015A72F0D|nr:hypothetical protein [Lentzea albida]